MNFEPQNPESTGTDASVEQPIGDYGYRTADGYYVLPSSARSKPRGWSVAAAIMLIAGIAVLVALVATAINALNADDEATDSNDAAAPTTSVEYAAPQQVPTLTDNNYILVSPYDIDSNIEVPAVRCSTVTTWRSAGSSSLVVVPQVMRCSTAASNDVQPVLNSFFQAWASHDSDTALSLLAPGLTRDYATGMFESSMNYSPVDQVTVSNPHITIAMSESGYTLITAKVRGNVQFTDGSNSDFSAFLIKPVGENDWKIQSVSFR